MKKLLLLAIIALTLGSCQDEATNQHPIEGVLWAVQSYDCTNQTMPGTLEFDNGLLNEEYPYSIDADTILSDGHPYAIIEKVTEDELELFHIMFQCKHYFLKI